MNGHRAGISSMLKDSANQARLCLVVIHPPMPTEFPSAMASALARHESIGDNESDVVGMAWIRGSRQCRLFWALVSLMTGHMGSERRIHVGPVDLGIVGKSALQ